MRNLKLIGISSLLLVASLGSQLGNMGINHLGQDRLDSAIVLSVAADEIENHPVLMRERQHALEAQIHRWQDNSPKKIRKEIQRQKENGAIVYVVQWGDRLENIAKALNMEVSELQAMNQLEGNELLTGQFLSGVIDNSDLKVAGAYDDDDYEDDDDDDAYDDDYDDDAYDDNAYDDNAYDDDAYDDDDYDDAYDDDDDYDDDDYDDDDYDDDDYDDDDYDDDDYDDDDYDDAYDDDDYDDDDYDDAYDDDDYDDDDYDDDDYDDDDYDDDDYDYDDDNDDDDDDNDDNEITNINVDQISINDDDWLENFYQNPNNIPGHQPKTTGDIPTTQLTQESNMMNENDPTAPSNSENIQPVQPETTNNSGVDSQLVTEYFHQLVNQERQNQGVTTLQYGNQMQTAAENRTQEIITHFSHTRPNGQAFNTAPGFEQGGGTVGENLQQTYVNKNASPQEIAQKLFENWKNSPGHYENMMDPSFSDHAIQIDAYQDGENYIIYSTQVFTGQ